MKNWLDDIRDDESRGSVRERRFQDFCSSATRQNSAALNDLEGILPQNTWIDEPNLKIVCLSPYSNNQGHASPIYGTIGLKENFIRQGVDNPFLLFLAYHERTHLHIGSEIRQSILSNHKDLDDFFHSQVIPRWANGEMDIKSHGDYVPCKGWRLLYDDWDGPINFDMNKAVAAVNSYFNLLKRGHINYDEGKLWHISPTSSLWNVFINEPVKTPEELEKTDPNFMMKLVTGYELARFLHEDEYKPKLYRQFPKLLDLEEGFCNFVASRLSGADLGQFNMIACQDPIKIQLAERIMAANPPSAEEALNQVKSPKDLAEFYQRLGIVKI